MNINLSGYVLLNLLLVAIALAVPAGFLARDKGRNVVLWVVLALIPIINVPALIYIVGTPDRRVADRLETLLRRGTGTSPV